MTNIEFEPEFGNEVDAMDVDRLAEALLAGQPVEQTDEEKMKMRTVIFDIDGTLSNPKERLPYVLKDGINVPNWKKFFDEMDRDEPNDWAIRMSQMYYQTGFVIHIVTGRPEEYREKTEAWLKKFGVMYDFLHMRPLKDSRPDDEVKKEILYTKLPKKDLIEFVVDDRQKVVDMWREEGLVCLQCYPNQH